MTSSVRKSPHHIDGCSVCVFAFNRLMLRWSAMLWAVWRIPSPTLRSCCPPWSACGLTQASRSASAVPASTSSMTLPNSEYGPLLGRASRALGFIKSILLKYTNLLLYYWLFILLPLYLVSTAVVLNLFFHRAALWFKCKSHRLHTCLLHIMSSKQTNQIYNIIYSLNIMISKRLHLLK